MPYERCYVALDDDGEGGRGEGKGGGVGGHSVATGGTQDLSFESSGEYKLQTNQSESKN